MASRDRPRLLRAGWNAGRYALGPLAGVLIPWVVIHHASKAVWGEVVGVMVMVQLAAHVVNWGSKDLLLRSFALEPLNLSRAWWSSILTRSFLLLPSGLVLFLFLRRTEPFAAIVWLSLLFLSGSFDALVVQQKRFAASFAIDSLGLAVQVVGITTASALSADHVIHWVLIGQFCRLVLLVLLFQQDLRTTTRPDVRAHLVTALPFFLIGLSGLLGSRMDLYTMTALVDHDTLGTYQVVAALFVQLQALAALISSPFTRELYRLRGASIHKATTRLAKFGLLLLPLFVITAYGTFTYVFHFELPALTYAIGPLLVWPAFAYVPLITWLYKNGHERIVLLANFGAALTSLLLSLLLVPLTGMNGALLSAAIGQWLVLVIVRYSSNRISHALPEV